MSHELIKGRSFLARKGIPKKSENVTLSVFLLLYILLKMMSCILYVHHILFLICVYTLKEIVSQTD